MSVCVCVYVNDWYKRRTIGVFQHYYTELFFKLRGYLDFSFHFISFFFAFFCMCVCVRAVFPQWDCRSFHVSLSLRLVSTSWFAGWQIEWMANTHTHTHVYIVCTK